VTDPKIHVDDEVVATGTASDKDRYLDPEFGVIEIVAGACDATTNLVCT
jgi:hypothetical protein